MTVEQFLPSLIGGLLAGLGFFLAGALKKNDSNREDIALINQNLGLLNAAKDRSREEGERLQETLSDQIEELRAVRETVIKLEIVLEQLVAQR